MWKRLNWLWRHSGHSIGWAQGTMHGPDPPWEEQYSAREKWWPTMKYILSHELCKNSWTNKCSLGCWVQWVQGTIIWRYKIHRDRVGMGTERRWLGGDGVVSVQLPSTQRTRQCTAESMTPTNNISTVTLQQQFYGHYTTCVSQHDQLRTGSPG